jgi:hypothetical protein
MFWSAFIATGSNKHAVDTTARDGFSQARHQCKCSPAFRNARARDKRRSKSCSKVLSATAKEADAEVEIA